MLIELIGFGSAILTTFAFLPQVMLILRTRETKDISLTMYLMHASGVAGWLVYGVLIMSWPIIIANAVSLCLEAMIIGMKLRYR